MVCFIIRHRQTIPEIPGKSTTRKYATLYYLASNKLRTTTGIPTPPRGVVTKKARPRARHARTLPTNGIAPTRKSKLPRGLALRSLAAPPRTRTPVEPRPRSEPPALVLPARAQLRSGNFHVLPRSSRAAAPRAFDPSKVLPFPVLARGL